MVDGSLCYLKRGDWYDVWLGVGRKKVVQNFSAEISLKAFTWNILEKGRLAVGCPWALCRKVSNYFTVYFRQLRGYVLIIHILRFRKWLCRNGRHKLRIFCPQALCCKVSNILLYIFIMCSDLWILFTAFVFATCFDRNCHCQATYHLWR